MACLLKKINLIVQNILIKGKIKTMYDKADLKPFFKVTYLPMTILFVPSWIGMFYFVSYKDLPAVNTSSHSIFHPSKRIMVLHYRHFYGKTL